MKHEEEKKGMFDIGFEQVKKNAQWQHLLDYETDELRDCYTHNCDMICRCTEITDVRITGLSDVVSFLEDFFIRGDGHEGAFGYALAYLLVKNIFKEHTLNIMFDYDIAASYYGDEVNAIYPDFSNSKQVWYEVFKKFEHFNETTNSERVFQVLAEEYGYILPELEKYKEWELVKVPVEMVTANKRTLQSTNSLLVNYYRTFCPWWYAHAHAGQGQTKHAKLISSWFPSVIVIPNNAKYKLVDGNHRFAAWTTKPKYYSNESWKRNRRKKKIFVIKPKEQ